MSQPPEGNKEKIEKTSVEISWETNTSEENKCKLQKIESYCEAKQEENNFESNPWIIEYRNKSKEIRDNAIRTPMRLLIDGLSEFTNYTCYARLTNANGTSNYGNPIRFQTLEEGSKFS